MFDLQSATDAQLLARFSEGRDVQAFEKLIERYGPMVRATAQRLLQCDHDVDDAVQATFFALAKLAGNLRQKASVASWLHRTALNNSTEIIRAETRWKRKSLRLRNALEGGSGLSEQTDPAQRLGNVELRQVLDEELARLPEHLKVAVILCDLKGLTQKQAAEQIGIPSSTVNDRVSKARRQLRDRLIKRGVSLTVAGLATCVASSADPASAMSQVVKVRMANDAAKYVARSLADSSATAIGLADKAVTAAKLTHLLPFFFAVPALFALWGSYQWLSEKAADGAKARTAVSPIVYGNEDAPSESDVWPQASRGMSIYDSSLFETDSAGPIRITSFNIRPDGRHPIEAVFGFERLTLRFAITPASPDDMSPKFGTNVAKAISEPVVVFDDAWKCEVASSTPTSGAREFDFRVKLRTPFEFEPTQGNLLVDWKFGEPISGQAGFDRGDAQLDQATFWSPGQDPAIGRGPFSVVTQFEYEVLQPSE